MDGKSGFDVAQYLREVGHTPFVFLSAFSDEQTVTKVRSLGALDYLVKPLEMAQIVPTIDAAFARARAMRAATRPPIVDSAQARPLEGSEPGGPDAMVSVAVGIVMHRFSMRRRAALRRLERDALTEGRSLRAQAERVVHALEDLCDRDDA
jgi:response regulator NasT